MRTAAIVFLLSLAVAGCGGVTTFPIAGSVSLDGEPVSQGSIVFKPTSGTNPSAAAQIVDGKYSVKLQPGTYGVEILASRAQPGKQDAVGMPLVEQYIPAKYNVQSELQLDVGAGNRSQDWLLSSET